MDRKHIWTAWIILGLILVLATGCTSASQSAKETVPPSPTSAPVLPTVAPTEDKVSPMLEKITWLRSTNPYGNTGVLIQAGTKVIYLDPVDLVNAAQLPKADIILITHDHPDHFSAQTITALSNENTKVVSTAGIISTLGDLSTAPLAPGEKTNVDNLEIEGIASYNVNHPKTSGFLGFIITIDDTRLYFSGDTDLNPEMESLSNIDIAFLNVRNLYSLSGKNVVSFAETVKPRVIVPIHWMPENNTYKDKEEIEYIQQNIPNTTLLEVLTLKP
ncbi:MAG: MBL fold metallo-hydrolase [Anaerolineales bacterium]|nr:MBL fold metallo-hydrolase [Anaerolineales bacterium]